MIIKITYSAIGRIIGTIIKYISSVFNGKFSAHIGAINSIIYSAINTIIYIATGRIIGTIITYISSVFNGTFSGHIGALLVESFTALLIQLFIGLLVELLAQLLHIFQVFLMEHCLQRAKSF